MQGGIKKTKVCIDCGIDVTPKSKRCRLCWFKVKKAPWLKKYRFEKGHIPWLKGKSVQTNTGKTHFKKGHKLNFGKKRPDMSIAQKGKRLPALAYTNSQKRLKELGYPNRTGKKHLLETKKKISESRKGKAIGRKNVNWKGGVTSIKSLVRNLPEYSEWRNGVFERDNYTCYKCGKRGVYLEADHYPVLFAKLLQETINLYGKNIEKIRKYEPLWDINNGRTVCKKDHKRVFAGNQYMGGIYL